MKYERHHDWRATIRAIDPQAEAKISDFIGYTVARESRLPRKTKELFLMAAAAAVRYGVSTAVHGRNALEQGATREELIEVLSIVAIQAGFTSFVDAVEALGDVLAAESLSP